MIQKKLFFILVVPMCGLSEFRQGLKLYLYKKRLGHSSVVFFCQLLLLFENNF